MNKYTSTYILRANPCCDEIQLRQSILTMVNSLNQGEKRVIREWIKLEIEIPHPTTKYWVFVSSSQYEDRKPSYFYFSFKRTLQLLPKQIPCYFPGLDVASTRQYAIKGKNKDELEKHLKLHDLEEKILMEHNEHIRMEQSIRSLEEKLANDKEFFETQLKISADQIGFLNARVALISTIGADPAKSSHQCSIF